MPRLSFKLIAVVEELATGDFYAEVFRLPRVSALSETRKQLFRSLRKEASTAIAKADPEGLHQLALPDMPEMDTIDVVLDPLHGDPAWRTPLTATFSVARWSHEGGGHVARVPALGIEVVSETEDGREDQLPREIHGALMRERAVASLKQIARCHRAVSVELVEFDVTTVVKTAKEQSTSEGVENKPDHAKFLKKIGTRLEKKTVGRAYELDDVVRRLADLLGGKNPRAVLLVGPSGVGKTAAVHELVSQSSRHCLGTTQFWETSGARLVSGMSGFGMWQERCKELLQAAKETGIILHMGSLIELMEVGKSVSNKEGIATFLRPHIARGDLLAVLECTPEQVPLIERQDPLLLTAFSRVDVSEPSPDRTRSILLGTALARARGRASETVDTDSLELIDRLHRRHTPYSAYPGRPLRFLENLLRGHLQDGALTPQVVTQAFSRETGLPLSFLDDAHGLDLEETRNWFADRVIGQNGAIDLVTDLLAVVKTQLNRPKKPIASLLFIGPTGVGKTQLAKSLAEFLFGDPKRMVRFDMSEFADPIAVKRLIGGVFGAEGLLTAKVREQPFCVVLFDEFEKAHPLFFDIILQVLGEGRLCDAGGRIADFCSAVVVMTSNLGARSFQRGAVGLQPVSRPDEHARDHFGEEVRRFLRPELFNRIDRIVPFVPLTEEIVRRIARREIELIRGRDGIRYREILLETSEELVKHLADLGFDERYGARPLKRAVERKLLAPLADRVNAYAGDLPLAAKGAVHDGQVALHVAVKKREKGSPLSLKSGQVEITKKAIALRRKAFKLRNCSATRSLQNELYLAERFETRRKRTALRRGHDYTAEDGEKRKAELKRLRDITRCLEEATKQSVDFEDGLLERFYLGQEIDLSVARAGMASVEEGWQRGLHVVYASTFEHPDQATLAVYSDNNEALFMLTEAYASAASRMGLSVAVCRYVMSKPDGAGHRTVKRMQVRKDVNKYLETGDPDALGLAIELRGTLAFPRFEEEDGIHAVKWSPKSTSTCLVVVTDGRLADNSPPAGVERRGATAGRPACRTYSMPNNRASDKGLGKDYKWNRGLTSTVVETIIEERLRETLMAMINE